MVAAGATVTLDEAVPAHGSIHGRLSRGDGSGAFAFVQALGGAAGSVFTTTDPDGNYSMPYIWVGTYRVQFSPSGAPEQFAHQKTDFLSADLFNVTAGANLTVDDTLIPTGFITGRVTSQGQPAPQFVHIQILKADVPFEDQVASTFTNLDGTYRVGVLPGAYKVKFNFSSIGISQYAHQKTDLASADTFTVAEGEDVVVDEEAVTPSIVRGRLTNADGTPAVGAFVGIQSGQQFYGAAVGPAGDWSASVLPGTYTVSFATDLGTHGPSARVRRKQPTRSWSGRTKRLRSTTRFVRRARSLSPQPITRPALRSATSASTTAPGAPVPRRARSR